MMRGHQFTLALAAAVTSLLIGVAALSAASSGDADHPWLVLSMATAASILAALFVPLTRYVTRALVTGMVAFVTLAAASKGWIGDDWSDGFIIKSIWTVGLLLSLFLAVAVFCVSWLRTKWTVRP